MRKLLIQIISIVLCMSLVACGNTAGNDQEGINGSEEQQVQQSSTGASSEDEAQASDSAQDTQESVAEEEEIPFSTDYYEYDSMADMLAEYGIRFGTCMNATTCQDYALQGLVNQHFNSITATNQMKAYSLLDQNASMKAADGMPVMDYSGSIGIVEAAINNGAGIRGHVLVWDASMSDWFFREGYKSSGDYVDRETMMKRMESYITQVITFYEENYPGAVYCWDVVNEAVGDSSSDYAPDDKRHVRIYRSGTENLFYKVIGDDYVELAFLYAKNAVEALQAENPDVDIKLFYNDYSTFQSTKREAICKLIESINSYDTDAEGNARKLCDGVGMQGYIGGYGTQSGCMSYNDIQNIKTAIKRFAALDVEVQITEMSVRNYSDAAEDVEKHATFYAQLMRELIMLNSGEDKPITGISIWGLTDMGNIDPTSYSYKMNGPYCGLFTPGYEVKQAFHEVYAALKKLQ